MVYKTKGIMHEQKWTKRVWFEEHTRTKSKTQTGELAKYNRQSVRRKSGEQSSKEVVCILPIPEPNSGFCSKGIDDDKALLFIVENSVLLKKKIRSLLQ